MLWTGTVPSRVRRSYWVADAKRTTATLIYFFMFAKVLFVRLMSALHARRADEPAQAKHLRLNSTGHANWIVGWNGIVSY